MAPIIEFLQTGDLPEEIKLAWKIVLTGSQYTLLEKVLYRVEPDATLRIVPPQSLRQQLLAKVHGGRFSAHLSDVKVYSALRRHYYWWPGMKKDVTQRIKACLTCVTHHLGLKVKPPLTPIPVGGAFDRFGVDILQLPETRCGNCYAVVFGDYLTKWPEVFAVADQSSSTIAKLLVVSRHGVPSEILSDRGRAFLS